MDQPIWRGILRAELVSITPVGRRLAQGTALLGTGPGTNESFESGTAGLNLANIAEVSAEPEMNHAEFFPAVAVERESTEDNDAGPVHDMFAPGIDIVSDGVERKIVTRHHLGVAGLFFCAVLRARSSACRCFSASFTVALSRLLWSVRQAPGCSSGNSFASVFMSPFAYQDAILRNGERRVTAPPSPSMVSLKPRSL